MKKANDLAKEILARYQTAVIVEAVKQVPAESAEQVERMDVPARQRFFADWMRKLRGISTGLGSTF